MFGAEALFYAAWRQHRNLCLGLGLAFFLFELLVAGVYDTTLREAIALIFTGAQTPRFILAIGGSSDIFSPEGWLGLGYAHPLALIMLTTWTIGFGSNAIAGEVEDGTAEFLGSRPVDRSLVLAVRFFACGVGLALVLGVGYVATVVGTFIVKDLATFDRLRGLRLPLAVVPTLVAIAGVAFLGSTVSSTRGRANAIAITFAVGSYLLNFAAIMWDPVKPLAPLSIFHYLDPAKSIRVGITWSEWIPALFGLILIVVAHEVFHRRDAVR
jgi:ABC-2 type transport system permease protein